MPSWESHFAQHDLWAKLDSLLSKLNEIPAPEDDDTRDTLEYAIEATALAAQRRHNTPALQVTSAMLDGTASAVESVAGYIEAWQDGAYSDATVDAQTAALIQSLAAWPPLTTQDAAKSQTDASERVTRATTEAIKTVAKKRDELVAQFEELENKQSDLATQVTDQTTLISNAIAEFKTGTKDEVNAAVQQWDEARSKHETVANQHVETLRGLEKEAREMVHATTGSTVATDYGKYARNKTIAAWICDVAAAVIGAVGVAAILYHLYSAGTGADGDVGLSLTRLAASLGTLGLAALVAHRGHDHHKEARAAKRTDLAIQRVGPYTANLPPDARERITLEMTDRIFIRGELDEATTNDTSQPSIWHRIRGGRPDGEPTA